MKPPMRDERIAYETMIKMKEEFGTFHKTCFHTEIETNQTELGAAIETISYKHTRDYFDGLDDELYQVGYSRNDKGQEIDIVVRKNTVDEQYIEAKYRNDSAIKDTDGIVAFGMPNTPGYVISKEPDDYGLTERKGTKLYRIPAVAYFYLIGRESAISEL